MKVALLSETFLPQINGVVRTVERIIHHLEAQGHEVLLITIGEGDEHYSKTKVVRLEGIPFNLYPELSVVKPEDKWLSKLLENEITQTPTAILQSLLPSKHSVVEAALSDFKPDLIHLVTPVSLGAIGIYYIDEWQLPSLATFHTDLAAYAPMYQIPYIEEIINTVTKLVYSKANRILAPSPSTQEQLEEIGLENVGVFGRGVDHELFNPSHRNPTVLSKHGLDPKRITIAYVGRLAEEKSIDELIEAYLELERSYNNIQLLIVGDGPIRNDLEDKLKNNSDDYAFTGIQKAQDLAKLYASADIFAFPSRTETFGQVVLEAMASGLAVVGYDSPGVRDLIQHGESGLLANEDLSFKDALEELIKNNELRSKYGLRSRELSLERSWNNILDKLVQEYKQLLNSQEQVLK